MPWWGWIIVAFIAMWIWNLTIGDALMKRADRKSQERLDRAEAEYEAAVMSERADRERRLRPG